MKFFISIVYNLFTSLSTRIFITIGPAHCVCPSCGYKAPHVRGIPYLSKTGKNLYFDRRKRQ